MITARTEKELDEEREKLKAQYNDLKEEYVLTYDDTLNITIYSTRVIESDCSYTEYYEMINTPFYFNWRKMTNEEITTMRYHDVPF